MIVTVRQIRTKLRYYDKIGLAFKRIKEPNGVYNITDTNQDLYACIINRSGKYSFNSHILDMIEENADKVDVGPSLYSTLTLEREPSGEARQLHVFYRSEVDVYLDKNVIFSVYITWVSP